MKRLAVLAVAGLVSVTASASNWVNIAQSAEGDEIYVDTDSAWFVAYPDSLAEFKANFICSN